jgi:protein-S-isoprenylcysteine O-methyltransferase Ste14
LCFISQQLPSLSQLFDLSYDVVREHPAAPPRKLILRGPYGLSRNPIQLGAMFYYLGLGCLCSGIPAGLFAFGAALLFGSLYHKLVEEKELLARFGADYESYRRQTPFLVPRFRKRSP